MLNEKVIYEKYSIVKVDEDCYLVPEFDFISNSKEVVEGTRDIEIIDINNLIVNDGDVVCITLEECGENGLDILRVENVDREDHSIGYVKGYYFSDNERYETVKAIAKLFSDKKVYVSNWLIYSEKDVEDYINALKSI